MSEEKKAPTKKANNELDIEVIKGDGKGLNISPVYDHIKIDKPSHSTDKNKKVVIPKSKDNKE